MFGRLLLSLSILALGACANPTSGDGDTAPPEVYEQDLTGCQNLPQEACEVYKAGNYQRRKNGLSVLKISIRCQAMAEAHAEDMARNNFFDHSSPTRGRFAERLANSGLEGVAGENLAMNYPPNSVVNAWMNSAPHRANLLDRRFRSTGVAVAYGANGAIYYVQCYSSEPGLNP